MLMSANSKTTLLRREVLLSSVALVTACGGGSSTFIAATSLSPSTSGSPPTGTGGTSNTVAGGSSANTKLSITSISNTSPSVLSFILVTLQNAIAGVAVTGTVTLNGNTYPLHIQQGSTTGAWRLVVPLYLSGLVAGQTAGYNGVVALTQGTQQVTFALTVQDLPTLSSLGVAPGQIKTAFFNYLQLSVGRTLNALQTIRIMNPIAADSAKVTVLDTSIAAKLELLASLASFNNAADQLTAGSANTVVIGTQNDGTAIILDSAGMQTMERIIAAFMLSLPNLNLAKSYLGLETARALTDFAAIAAGLRYSKNVLNIDSSIVKTASNPVDLALLSIGAAAATIGAVAALAALGLPAAAVASLAVVAEAAAVSLGVGQAVAVITAGGAIFTALVNGAASGYGAVTAISPSDEVAQYRGVTNSAGDVVVALRDAAGSFVPATTAVGAGIGFIAASFKNAGILKQENATVISSLPVINGTDPSTQVTQTNISAPPPTSTTGSNPTDSPPTLITIGTDVLKIQSVADSLGNGTMCSPGNITATPTKGGVSNAETGVLQGSTPLLPGTITKGGTIPIPSSWCGIAGRYVGSFSGDDSGPATVAISASGTLTGSATSSRFGNAISGSGNVSLSGKFVLVTGTTTGGASFSGDLVSSTTRWTVSGTWSNPTSKLSGIFSVQQSSCA